jgi:RimJ/RimL family protein N-acetyltransferase
MSNQIILSNGSVLLRRYHESDGKEIFQAVRESLKELSPRFAWSTNEYTMEDADNFIKNQRIWWENGKAYNFAITDKGSGTYAGGILLNNIDHNNRFANLAYWVRSSWTGKGTSASTKLIAAYGFKDHGLNRIEIILAKDNLPNLRVAEKVGAKREGELRNRITVKDKVYDAFLYSLIPQDISESNFPTHSNR